MESKLKEKNGLHEFEALERKAEKDQEVKDEKMWKHKTKLKLHFVCV